MKILRLQPSLDTPTRYNYGVNYGVWDQLETTQIPLHHLPNLSDSFFAGFDVVLLPMYKRWEGLHEQLDRLKGLPIKTVLFDNDCCYRSFTNDFYTGIDFIFYRMTDMDDTVPIQPSERLLWSVDTDKFTPRYGGKGISFNCTIDHNSYRLRQQINRIIKATNHTGGAYIKHLQGCCAAIHTNSEVAPMPRAKMLEFAACGTEIISNRMDGIDDYFDLELITFFDNVEHLRQLVVDFRANENVQKLLRIVVEENHSDKIRAQQVIHTLNQRL